jgi:DNA-binding response OmpR family regulator
MRVLVVDDEVDLAEAVARGLRREGYAVDVAFDGDDALGKAALTPYDLVCLDRTMPGLDGLEVCRRLHELATTGGEEVPRVLMLTARDSLDDRVDGLDAGADDYLVKPFELRELAARVRALLRRDSGGGGSVLEVGRLALDDVRRSATRDGEALDLTAKELSLLRYFMAHPDQVLSQEHLLEHVWDEHTDPFTNTVRVTVGTLRRKLAAAGGDDGPIETLVGQGYRLLPAG